MKTFIGYFNIYAHLISKLLLNKQILDIKTFIGYTNIGYQNFDCIRILDIKTLIIAELFQDIFIGCTNTEL